MPCTGSLKSGVSIMLSCLSPRRPCCGPNAAARLKSPNAASASSECVRFSVTDAGWATRATRLPASDARSDVSASRRSIEFVIRRTRRGADERLEASAPPEFVATRGRGRCRQAQTADPAVQPVAQLQAAWARPLDLHCDVCDRSAAEAGVAYQDMAH